MFTYNSQKLRTLEKQIEQNFIIYQNKFEELKSISLEIDTLNSEVDKLNLLTAYFNKIVDSKRKEIIDKVIGMVSFGLQSVMEDNTIKLVVEPKMQRNQKFYTFLLEKNGNRSSILNYVGGGVVNLLVFLLHVVLLTVSSNRKFLILDEPFAALSSNYRENIGEFLKLLRDKTGIQFLIISHQTEIDEAAEILYQIRQIGDEIRFVKIK